MEKVYDSKSSGQGPLARFKCFLGAKVSEGGRQAFRLQGMMGGLTPAISVSRRFPERI